MRIIPVGFTSLSVRWEKGDVERGHLPSFFISCEIFQLTDVMIPFFTVTVLPDWSLNVVVAPK